MCPAAPVTATLIGVFMAQLAINILPSKAAERRFLFAACSRSGSVAQVGRVTPCAPLVSSHRRARGLPAFPHRPKAWVPLPQIGVKFYVPMYPTKLDKIINLFESLPEDERRETLVSYADNATKQEPRETEKFDLVDVRK